MKTFDQAVSYARGRLVEAQKIVAKYEPKNYNNRKPKPVPTKPDTPTKNPNGKAS